jgi:osmotically inducible protein OsmC
MADRKSTAYWEGDLKSGSGTMTLGSGAWAGAYSYSSRFEEGMGSNPEELIAAAHAGCFSMAFANALSKAGFTPDRVETVATVHLGKVDGSSTITHILLDTEVEVDGIDEDRFMEIANEAKVGCPVSKALKAVEIDLNAKLVR